MTFYNRKKGAVSTLDKLLASYDVSRNSRRWPLTIFYSIFKTAGINFEIVFRKNANNYSTTRREFLKNMGKEFIGEHQKRRLQNKRHPNGLREAQSAIQAAKQNVALKRKRCEFCPGNSENHNIFVLCVRERLACHTQVLCAMIVK